VYKHADSTAKGKTVGTAQRTKDNKLYTYKKHKQNEQQKNI